MNQKLLIVGLGNPGDKYKNTRHNIGFDIIDKYTEKLGIQFKESKKFESVEILQDSRKIYFLKPIEFMNLSGGAVSELKNKNGIDISKILIIHDEIDFVFGKCKMKIGGGHAGHNGLRDITEKIGPDFHRLRIGVGKPTDGREVSDYVLGRFTPEEKKSLLEVSNLCLQKIDDWIKIS